MASADQAQYDEAERYFRQSHEIAERAGDAYLGGLCLVNHAKVHIARERYEDARHDAEAALAVFDRLGVGSAKADAYRVLGMIYRETSRPALAESRLKSAIELAVGAAERRRGRRAGAGRGRADDGAARRLSPRSREGARPARDSQQARPADARRVRGGPDASDLGDRAAREGRVPLGYQARHPLAPRALRRDRLSRPPARRRDPSRGTDRGHRGRVRRPHYHASLPPRVFAAGSARADRPVPRALVGRGVQRLLHGAGSRRGLTPVAHPFPQPTPSSTRADARPHAVPPSGRARGADSAVPAPRGPAAGRDTPPR